MAFGLELLGTIITGPLMGLLATWLQNKNEKERRKVELENQVAVMASQERLAQVELEKIKLTGANELQKTLAESQGALALAAMQDQSKPPLIESAPEGSPIIRGFFAYVDIVTRAMRPHITLAFAALLIYLNIRIFSIETTAVIVAKHGEAIILSTLIMTETVIVWWFGGRMTQLGKQTNGIS